MSKQRERLEFDAKVCKFEVQAPAAGSTAQPKLIGYAMVWNTLSSDRGGYVARLAPGSASPDPDGVQALYAHDNQKVLGNTANDTLRFAADDYGMRVEINPPDTTYARDVATLVRDKYVRGMSFGMTPVEFTDAEENGQNVRTFTKFIFDEVTITGIPAFSDTTIGAQFQKATPAATSADVEFEQARFRFQELDD